MSEILTMYVTRMPLEAIQCLPRHAVALAQKQCRKVKHIV